MKIHEFLATIILKMADDGNLKFNILKSSDMKLYLFIYNENNEIGLKAIY